jgi:hypothetical protein
MTGQKRSNQTNACTSCTCPTVNPTRTGQEWNSVLRGEKLWNNCLRNGTSLNSLSHKAYGRILSGICSFGSLPLALVLTAGAR